MKRRLLLFAATLAVAFTAAGAASADVCACGGQPPLEWWASSATNSFWTGSSCPYLWATYTSGPYTVICLHHY